MSQIKNRMKKGLLTLGLLIGCLTSLQAQKIISGKIVDENNKPLSNVMVQDSQTKKWTQTNNDGSYSIEISGENSLIIVSQLGRETQEINIDPNDTTLSITLYKHSLRLDEVIVTSKKKKDFLKLH